MNQEHRSSDDPSARAQRLAEFFVGTPLLRLRIEREGEEFEFTRSSLPALRPDAVEAVAPPQATRPVDTLRADVVGILHFARRMPTLGDEIDGDLELGAIEALGIRTSIRTAASGRLKAILCGDGAIVDYGRALFEIERG